MTDIIIKNSDFMDIYNKSYRLAAAVFLISNVIENNDELKTKMKKLSLDLVSMSVNLKDISFDQTNNLLRGIEKNALELISMLDIASVSGLISEMNGRVIKGEFQAFISELNKFSDKSNEDKNSSVKSIFADINKLSIENNFEKTYPINNASQSEVIKNNLSIKNGNGHKRKDTRKNMILEFIKGHNNASIKERKWGREGGAGILLLKYE